MTAESNFAMTGTFYTVLMTGIWALLVEVFQHPAKAAMAALAVNVLAFVIVEFYKHKKTKELIQHAVEAAEGRGYAKAIADVNELLKSKNSDPPA